MAVALAPGMAPPGRRLLIPHLHQTPMRLKLMDLDYSDYNYLRQDWFLVPALTKKAMWSEPYSDEGGGEVFMTTYSVPVVKGGRLWAVVTANVHLDDLDRLVQELPPAQGGRAILLTRQGIFLAPQDRTWSGIFSLAEGLKRSDLLALGQVMIADRAGLGRLPDWTDGQPVWVAYAPVRGPGWSYVEGVIPGDEVGDLARILIKNAAFHHREPLVALAEANTQPAADNELCLLVTVFYGLHQISSGRLRYAWGTPPCGGWTKAEPSPCPPARAWPLAS